MQVGSTEEQWSPLFCGICGLYNHGAVRIEVIRAARQKAVRVRHEVVAAADCRAIGLDLFLLRLFLISEDLKRTIPKQIPCIIISEILRNIVKACIQLRRPTC